MDLLSSTLPGSHKPSNSLLRSSLLAIGLHFFQAQMAIAQEQPVRIIVSLPAGGGVDTVARYLGQQLSTELQRPVMVENRPGASGTLAAKAVMNAPANSLTLLAGGNQEVTIAPHLLGDSNYKPLTGLMPLLQVGIVPSVLVAKKDAGLNLNFFIQSVKEDRKLSIGIPGRGTPMHIALEDMSRQIAGEFLAVPYKGAPDVLVGVLSDATSYGAVGYPAAKSLLDAGSLMAVAVLANKRSDLLPSLPSVAEKTSVKGELPQVWYGFFVSRKSAPAEVSKVDAALTRVMKKEEVRKQLQSFGVQVTALPPGPFTKSLEAESAYYRNAIINYKVQ
ncbi:MAG: tripartite tricarboxylate transporter substrate binding protein [Comamonas sp.]